MIKIEMIFGMRTLDKFAFAMCGKNLVPKMARMRTIAAKTTD